MDFNLSEEQKQIISLAREIASDFPPKYWREKDIKGEFIEDFFRAVCRAGFTGLIIPERYGGSGRGITEFAIALEELAANGGGLGPIFLMITELFGGLSIVSHG